MKHLVGLVLAFGLVACQPTQDNLELYVAEVKARKYPLEEDIPEIVHFEHLSYQSSELRSPFLLPKPEVEIAPSEELVVDCDFQPDWQRAKGPLELVSLSSMSMRGVVWQDSTPWALVEAGSQVHRLKVGDFLGLHRGQITSIEPSAINITEEVEDGKGCWSKRLTQLALDQS
ncbi:pilus assembly protein PilP [Aliagarivorans marinus]|uniref:pilus assembly protein PilP n=1 Tax=Aliagarivorans marinus TaxID=561965 RepID=UPI000416D002|nr:pilus assembly protein PilP [Aliagarivorans marinus]